MMHFTCVCVVVENLLVIKCLKLSVGGGGEGGGGGHSTYLCSK